MNTTFLPYEDVDAAVREAAADQAWHDAEYDTWLDGFLSDAYEAWLNDVEPANELSDEPAEPEEPCLKCDGTGEEWLRVSGGDGWTGKPCPYCSYVPFQLDASEYADCTGNVTAEPGYLESTAPYLF